MDEEGEGRGKDTGDRGCCGMLADQRPQRTRAQSADVGRVKYARRRQGNAKETPIITGQGSEDLTRPTGLGSSGGSQPSSVLNGPEGPGGLLLPLVGC